MKKKLFCILSTGACLHSLSQSTSACTTYNLPWYIGGNNLGSNTSNVIGTCTNHDFILQANYKQSLFIKNNSYVGIGQNNNNPLAALDVSDGSGGTTPYHTKIFGDPLGAIESNTDMHLFFNNGNIFSIDEGTYAGGNWLPRFHVASGGNVGIGTTSPSSKLTIDATGLNNTSTNGLNIVVQNNSINPGYAMAVHNLNSSPNGIFAIWPDGRLAIGNTSGISDLAKVNVNMNSAGPAIDVFDQTSTTVFFRVYNDGKTVVGKPLLNTSPHSGNSLLTVNGKLVCKEAVITQQSWSDFVFDKNYKLMALHELETYYKENQHLPEVPSAKEITENGNDIGKTDALLLQKIEELTLYLVEQNKKNEEQQKEIDYLKKHMTEKDSKK
jgi:hypothetical protein